MLNFKLFKKTCGDSKQKHLLYEIDKNKELLYWEQLKEDLHQTVRGS